MSPCWRLLSASSLIIFTLFSPSVALPSSKRGPSASSVSSSYQLVDSWHGENFFSGFNFFTGPDPTHGFVNYIDQASAEAAGIIDVFPDGNVYLGVDWTTTLTPGGPGRSSVRLESKKTYENGLFIVDLHHVPGNACGTWPAFWTYGPSWPEDGEIDIIEAVNLMTSSQIVLHTGGTCGVSPNNMLGALVSTQCSTAATQNVGCVVDAGPGTFGTPVNTARGGVYAMELTGDHIAVWYFTRGAVPPSISSDNPDVSTFGTPRAYFQGPCNLAEQFNQQKMVFDITFCGDWAGNKFGESGCPVNAGSPQESCVNYVASHPNEYRESYWEVASVKVYQGASSILSSFSTIPSSSAARPSGSASAFASHSRIPTSHFRRLSAGPTNVPGFQGGAAPGHTASRAAFSNALIAGANPTGVRVPGPAPSAQPAASSQGLQGAAFVPVVTVPGKIEPQVDPTFFSADSVFGGSSLKAPVDSPANAPASAPAGPPADPAAPPAPANNAGAPPPNAPVNPPANPPADPPALPPNDAGAPPANAPVSPPANAPADPPAPPANNAGAPPANAPADLPAGPPLHAPADGPTNPQADVPPAPPANPPANPAPDPEAGVPPAPPANPPPNPPDTAAGPVHGPANTAPNGASNTVIGTAATSSSVGPTQPASSPVGPSASHSPGSAMPSSATHSPRPSAGAGGIAPIPTPSSSTPMPPPPMSTPMSPTPVPPLITGHSTSVPTAPTAPPGGPGGAIPTPSSTTPPPLFTGAANGLTVDVSIVLLAIVAFLI